MIFADDSVYHNSIKARHWPREEALQTNQVGGVTHHLGFDWQILPFNFVQQRQHDHVPEQGRCASINRLFFC